LYFLYPELTIVQIRVLVWFISLTTDIRNPTATYSVLSVTRRRHVLNKKTATTKVINICINYMTLLLRISISYLHYFITEEYINIIYITLSLRKTLISISSTLLYY